MELDELELEPVDEQQKPSTLTNILNDIPSMLVSGLESAVGTPGSVLQGASNLLNMGSRAIVGENILPEEIPYIPTIESIKERRRTGPTGLNYEPKTRFGQVASEFTSDLATLLSPIGAGPSLAKAAAMSGLGNLAKYGAQEINLGKEAQEGIKLGTMLTTSFLGSKSLDKIATDLFETVEKEAPVANSLSTAPLRNSVKKFKNEVSTGYKSKSDKEFLNNVLKEIKPTAKKTSISGQKAVTFYRDINKAFSGNNIPHHFKPLMHDLLGDFSEIINSAKKTNPEFVNAFNTSNNIYKTLRTSSGLHKFIANHTAPLNKYLNPVTALMLGHWSLAPFGLSVGSIGLKKAAEVADNVLSSPAIAKEYAKMISAAGKENGPMVLKAATKLNKMVEKEGINFPEEMAESNDQYIPEWEELELVE